ncbi:MAG TPA: hypothetical protein VFO20_01440, partial [Propionibacteriaceae bacterium]|nr:hypothetical protein [Propionibacteriaceae bacterium]
CSTCDREVSQQRALRNSSVLQLVPKGSRRLGFVPVDEPHRRPDQMHQTGALSGVPATGSWLIG